MSGKKRNKKNCFFPYSPKIIYARSLNMIFYKDKAILYVGPLLMNNNPKASVTNHVSFYVQACEWDNEIGHDHILSHI